MTVRADLCVAVAAALLASAPAGAVVLTGKVRTEGAQSLLAPPSLITIETLRFYVPDGTHVQKGQPVLRINASTAASQLQSLEDKITLAKATSAKKLAALKLKANKARLALVDAVAARNKAAVDATVPKHLISGLKYDQYQGTYKSDKRDAALKQKELAAARANVARQRSSGGLKLKKLETKLAFDQGQVKAATVRATRDGTVVHGFQNGFSIRIDGGGGGSSSGRYRQGSMVFPGTQVGQVVGAGSHYSVRAWALQPDRRGLKVGQAVRVHFDALPQADVGGHITAISNATQVRRTWGNGHYYRIDIALDPTAAQKLPLLPGMSVRIQTNPDADHKPAPAHDPRHEVLHVTGDVIAQKTWRVVPPKVPGVWELKITRMAPDGTLVKKGQPLVTFAAGSLAQKFPATVSKLAESKRARDQLRLTLANDKQTVKVAVAKAKGDAVTARRKAKQPKQYIAAIKYKKLVINLHRMDKRLKLTHEKAKVAAASRNAQMAVANAKVAELASKVKRMKHSMASLTVRAPRAGLFLHTVRSNGTRVSNGSQVFRGQTVASMPDMHSLAVRASLPERDLRRVHVGQAVQVVLSGGASRTLNGHIATVGRNVHSKSNAQPEPVVTLKIAFDGKPSGLKPGRAVSVDISTGHGKTS